MLALPIPMIVALVLGGLLIRIATSSERPPFLMTLLVACAVQSLIVSLRQHYGVAALLPFQPITATFVPPLTWLAFQTASFRPFSLPRDLVHLLPPGFAAFCVIFAPDTLDMVVPAIFVLYGFAILARLHRSCEDLPLARLESGRLPARIWRGIALALILSALSDALIALAFITGEAWLPPIIVSVFSSAALLAIGLLAVSPSAIGEAEPQRPEQAQNPSEQDAHLVQRLDALLQADRLYLDPSLTLSRLARRLHVPAKQLSSAINLVSGENVSRYINRHRIHHACRALEGGANVTEAMLSSGFHTKSNFNREFRRITGTTPSEWQSDKDRQR
ncbi:helix-turn-helix domain-containing protein [Nitratireductor kimnyeongensis]|uniref:Helix-turn-helix domain-containing protein n=1 Tax=Nitratireductor kimnyeongensis TaxID=430679 RepID=A0ABW0TAV0_9HYPH|nr:helix-turn-helix domain-containing protein [Nitratireductor kimnyeongensis]QZZ36820.1 helix-turn-helix domain-containing protein [Nitratireductor kimnyeongensis]